MRASNARAKPGWGVRLKTIIAIGFIAFFVSSLAIGLRLVGLAWRNRGLPEGLIGAGILGIGPLGFALTVAALALGAARPRAVFAALLGAQIAISAGALATYVFTWRVFRLEARWAPALVALAAAVFGVSTLGRLVYGGYSLPLQLDVWLALQSAAVVACLFWGAGESLIYHGHMRRRLRLGLADPITTNRFLLWGLGIGSAGVGSAIANVAMWLRGNATPALDALTLSNSLFGLAAAILMWIAFLPPRAYIRWIESR